MPINAKARAELDERTPSQLVSVIALICRDLYSCGIRSNYSKPLLFVREEEDRVSARASGFAKGSLEYPLSKTFLRSFHPGCGPRPQGVRMESWLKARLGWKRGDACEERRRGVHRPIPPDAFFRTIDARQNFRAPFFSLFSLLLPFFATSGGRGEAARRAYVTPHLHNAAANCQCGRFENKICAAVPRRKGGAARGARGSCAGHAVSKAPGVRFKELCRRINFPDFQPP